MQTLNLEIFSRAGGPDAKEVEKNSRPWLVFLEGGCGGALIGKRTVLTAAHCGWKGNPRYVFVGEHDITMEDGEEKYMVQSIFDHANWGRGSDLGELTFAFDARMLILEKDVTLSQKVQIAALPDRNEECKQFGHSMDVCGWGRTWKKCEESSCDSIYPNKPMSLTYKCMDDIYCNKTFFGEFNICAGYPQNAENSLCYGDSGGKKKC